MWNVSKTIKDYLDCKDGHFAVQFAILALPLLVATTFVVDYTAAGSEKVKVKAALDAAVIAAVNENSLTMPEKVRFAQTHFDANYSGKIDIKSKASATTTRIEMYAEGLSPVTVSEALGVKGIEIWEKSAAEISVENTVCVLSLAPSGEDVITFEDGIAFSAPTCSVHANSTHPRAIYSYGDTAPEAKSFCTSGGVEGDFKPFAKGNCYPIEDPYANVKVPLPGDCIDGSAGGLFGQDGYKVDERSKPSSESENTTGNNIILNPGTYCAGLTVDGAGVTFKPGEYHIMDGALTFKDSAIAKGNGVTFILGGQDSRLKIESGADVYIKAPASGPLEGLAFMQVPFKEPGKLSLTYSNNHSEIKSGGKLRVLGTFYFPGDRLTISGSDSAVGAQSPATSFIGYKIHFGKKDYLKDWVKSGDAFVNVAVDHEAAGLPPILPKVETGARLVE